MADAQSKLLRDYKVTPAQEHDSQALGELITERHKGENLFADSAYKSAECDGRLAQLGINNYIHEKGARNRPLDEIQKRKNTIKSRIRCRIEHIFGQIENGMGGPGFEYIGIKRITAAAGLRNLTYNFVRYVQLIRSGQVAHGGGWIAQEA